MREMLTAGTQLLPFLLGLLLTKHHVQTSVWTSTPQTPTITSLGDILRILKLNLERAERKAWVWRSVLQGKGSAVRGIQVTSHGKTGSTHFAIHGAACFFRWWCGLYGRINFSRKQIKCQSIQSNKRNISLNPETDKDKVFGRLLLSTEWCSE